MEDEDLKLLKTNDIFEATRKAKEKSTKILEEQGYETL